MTIGVYTELIKEIKARLEANLTGAYVALGYTDERLTQDQEKFCLVKIDSITEEYGNSRQQNRKDGELAITVSCMKAILADEQNNLYETDSTGFVPFIEDVLDALNTETDSSTLNPQLENAATSMGFNVSNFISSRDRVWFDVNITIRTKPFLINNRGGN